MEKNKVDLYLMSNAKYFESSAIPMLRQNDDVMVSLQACELKDPTTTLLISIFLGSLGIDRFMIGDTGMGILKLLTGGCCGILTIYDWFTISRKVKQNNLATISTIL